MAPVSWKVLTFSLILVCLLNEKIQINRMQHFLPYSIIWLIFVLSTLLNKSKNAKWLFLTFSLKASHLPLLSYAVNNFLLILSVAVVERELLFLSSKKWSGDFKRLWQPWIFEILVFDSYRTQFKTLNYFVVSWVFGYFWFRYFYIDTKIVMNECTTWI